MPRKLVVCLPLLGLGACYLALSAVAQDNAHGKWISDPAGLATPAFVYDAPPAGFDPLAASDLELEQYGFPPRPPRSDSARYSAWKRRATLTRITPGVTPTTIYNGPARNARIGARIGGDPYGTTYSANSDNWSGYAVAGANGTFSSNNSSVNASWFVPAGHQAVYPPTCTSTLYYSFEWVGFDGWGSSDVLQAGTEADASCTSTLYSFWYEWYPLAETRISLPVAPGDYVSAVVWYTTSSPYGHVNLTNWTTGTGAGLGFNPPSGTTYVGNSAEWVLERPTISGTLADLPNVTDFFAGTFAEVGTTNYYPGSSPANVNIYSIDMVCPPWNPSSLCPTTTTISTTTLIGTEDLIFSPSSPAW
jgi:hypothetical protein